MTVLTPDDIMEGIKPNKGPVLIYDDDQIYIGGVLADHLAEAGHEVIFVTPSTMVSPWTEHTLEQPRIQKSLIDRGVTIMTGQTLTKINDTNCTISCIYTGRAQTLASATVVLVTERSRNTDLFDALQDQQLQTLELIGDAASPALIADAVYAGHMAARNFEKDPQEIDQQFFKRELISLANT